MISYPKGNHCAKFHGSAIEYLNEIQIMNQCKDGLIMQQMHLFVTTLDKLILANKQFNDNYHIAKQEEAHQIKTLWRYQLSYLIADLKHMRSSWTIGIFMAKIIRKYATLSSKGIAFIQSKDISHQDKESLTGITKQWLPTGRSGTYGAQRLLHVYHFDAVIKPQIAGTLEWSWMQLWKVINKMNITIYDENTQHKNCIIQWNHLFKKWAELVRDAIEKWKATVPSN